MANPYSGLGVILESHLLPMVRAGNLSKDELGLLNDCASQARRTMTNSLKFMGRGLISDEADNLAEEENFLFNLGHCVIALAEGIEALVQIERDCEDFAGNSEAMKLLYSALKPQEEIPSA